jgi:hypothetical protein
LPTNPDNGFDVYERQSGSLTAQLVTYGAMTPPGFAAGFAGASARRFAGALLDLDPDPEHR